jgi:arylsulfatase A-like enzyme
MVFTSLRTEYSMQQTPNVIFIYADDLGRGMLSCYGQKHFQTPNIDRIAGEGVRFTRSYGCAFCAPARASLLTGLHDCHRNGFTYSIGRVYEKLTAGEITLEELSELINTTGLQACEDEVFLGEIARDAGYATAEIGKLEWGFSTSAKRIRRHGWEYHYGYYDHAQCHGFYPKYLFEDGKVVEIPGNTRDDFGKTPRSESPENKALRWDITGKAVYSQDLFDEKILAFLRANRDRPFFLFHPSQLPHGPISIPEIHPAVRDNPELTDFEKEYASMVLRLDETVGKILHELEVLGIDENTVVVFCSDNGHQPYYQQEGRMELRRNLQTGQDYDNVTTKFYSECSGDVFDGNDGMAGLKFTSWEGGVRIPYLVRWPGKINPGRISDHLFAGYDFLPTLAELLGKPCPEGKDGISFLPELLGKRDQQTPHDYIVFASGRCGPALVRQDGWKIRHCRRPGENLHQLFDLSADYREETDLAWDQREITEQLSVALLRECEGNLAHGMPETHQVYFPGLNFVGPECHWDILEPGKS